MKLLQSTRLRMNPCLGQCLGRSVWVPAPHLPVFAHQDLGLGASPHPAPCSPIPSPWERQMVYQLHSRQFAVGKKSSGNKNVLLVVIHSQVQYSGISSVPELHSSRGGIWDFWSVFCDTVPFAKWNFKAIRNTILHKWHFLESKVYWLFKDLHFLLIWSFNHQHIGQSRTASSKHSLQALLDQPPEAKKCFCPALFSWGMILYRSAGRFGVVLGSLLSCISCKVPYIEQKRFNFVYVFPILVSVEQQAVPISWHFPWQKPNGLQLE